MAEPIVDHHVPRHLRRRRAATRPSATCASTTPCTGPRRPTAAEGSGASPSTTTCCSPVAHTELFSSRLGIRLEDMDAEETEARRTMMEMDSPEHTRLRRLVSRPFAPTTVAAYEDAVRALVVEMLDSTARRARVRLRQPTSRVSCRCGCSGDSSACPTRTSTGSSSAATRSSATPTPISRTTSSTRVDTVGLSTTPLSLSGRRSSSSSTPTQALEERRLTPTHDVLSALLEPTTDGDTLDDLALKNFFTLMVAAGNDTTRYTMTGGLLAVSSNGPRSSRAIPSMTMRRAKDPDRRDAALDDRHDALSPHRHRRPRATRQAP